jgi:hypothetical protein
MIMTSPLNGGAGLTGKSGRNTANACDNSAKDTSRDTAANFMFVVTNTSQKVYHLCAVALQACAITYRR